MAVHSAIGKHARRCSYLLISVFALISSAATAHAPQSPPASSAIHLMPMPLKVTPAAGRLMVMQTFSVAIAGSHEPRLEHAAQRFLRDLSRQTGYFLSERLADVHTDSPAFPDRLGVVQRDDPLQFRHGRA